jgi:CRISPR-associated protein (Cas_Cas02710)
MGLGRMFRRLGLPAWTFIGIGVSAIWFNYVGVLLEKSVRDALRVNEQSSLWLTYAPPVIVFLVPCSVIVIAYLWQRWKYPLSKLKWRGGKLVLPEGKKGLILLISNQESALFAVKYHYEIKKTLEKVWLIPSNGLLVETFGPSTRPTAELIAQECRALAEKEGRPLDVEVHPTGVSPADSQDTFDYVRRIFREDSYKAGELIADFTGGTKPMSIGVIMACLPAERELEYVSLNRETGSHGPFLIDYQHRAFDLIG